MRYSKVKTDQWITTLGLENCKRSLQLILEKDGCAKGKVIFQDDVTVLDGDCAEGKYASQERRSPFKSMDSIMIIENSGVDEVLFVELRCNYISLRNLRKQDLLDKRNRSENMVNNFGNSCPIHESDYFVFDKSLKEQARRQFRNLNPKIPNNFISIDTESLLTEIDFTL